MEELRSTEILDREIQDDARRKAEKILKAGEAECAQIRADSKSHLALLKAEKEELYRSMEEAYRKDVLSAVPLEKQRELVSFIDTSVQAAFDEWFTSLGPAKRLSSYSGILRKYGSVFAGKSLRVRFSGYAETEIRRCVESCFPKESVETLISLDSSAASGFGFTDGLLVESADGSIVARATREELRSTLLSEKRQEMAEVLMGGRLPQ